MSDGWRAALRKSPLASQLRLMRLNAIARAGAHQRFPFAEGDADWRAALERAKGGKRVLIATNLGGHFPLATIDRLLGLALTLRGAAVTHVLCDRALSACQMCEIGLTPALGRADKPDPLLCGFCFSPAETAVSRLDLPAARLSASLTAADRRQAEDLARAANVQDLAALQHHGVAIGEHALAGALRFFARSDLAGEARGEIVLRRYIEAAVLTVSAYGRLIDELAPEVLVSHHGIYVPQGLAASTARAKGVRVVAWNPAYRRHCFIFSHDDTYHHTLLDEPVEAWSDAPLSDGQRDRVTAYLRSRREGQQDWIRFHRDPDYTLTADLAALGFDAGKPLIVALTNVFWDAQLHYAANAFAGQAQWLIETIDYFSKRPELQLAIRVHPAEVSGSPPSRQRAADVIRARFPKLAPNIKLIDAESALSTYALCDRADAALIYGTKTGVELSAVGLPVIVAGEAWVRGKGFTHDAASPEDYRAKLDMLPFRRRLSPDMQELALRYANHFFFRRMLELPFVTPVDGPTRYRVELQAVSELAPGRFPGLDTICAGILEKAPFICDTAPQQ